MRKLWLQGLVLALVTTQAGASDPLRERLSRGLEETRARRYANADFIFQTAEMELSQEPIADVRRDFEFAFREIREALNSRVLTDYEILRRVERSVSEIERLLDRQPRRDPRGEPRNSRLLETARELEARQDDLQRARWGRDLDRALLAARRTVTLALDDVSGELLRNRYDSELRRAQDALERARRALEDRFSTSEQTRSVLLSALPEAVRSIRMSDACREENPGPRPGPRPVPIPRPRYETTSVRCDSRDNLRARCDTRVIGLEVRVTYQRSRAECIYGRTYGLEDGGRTLWVDGGCRGVFEVSFRR